MFERLIPVLRKNEPAGNASNPFEAMERFMREPFAGFAGFPGFAQKGDLTPLVDVTETKDQVLVNAELPGLDPQDVELTLENGILTIKGQKPRRPRKGKGQHVLAHEIRYGAFSRSMALPGEVQADKASASFDKGVLKITIPKAENFKPTRVVIQGQDFGAGNFPAPICIAGPFVLF